MFLKLLEVDYLPVQCWHSSSFLWAVCKLFKCVSKTAFWQSYQIVVGSETKYAFLCCHWRNKQQSDVLTTWTVVNLETLCKLSGGFGFLTDFSFIQRASEFSDICQWIIISIKRLTGSEAYITVCTAVHVSNESSCWRFCETFSVQLWMCVFSHTWKWMPTQCPYPPPCCCCLVVSLLSVGHLTNRMWFSVVCTRINNEYVSSQWSKCCGLMRRSQVSPQQVFTTVMMHIVVDKSTDIAKPHSICFLPQYQHQRKCLFQCTRAEKGNAWQLDASSIV